MMRKALFQAFVRHLKLDDQRGGGDFSVSTRLAAGLSGREAKQDESYGQKDASHGLFPKLRFDFFGRGEQGSVIVVFHSHG